MKYNKLISSPTGFVAEQYQPGYTIDFTLPADTTDLEAKRAEFDVEKLVHGFQDDIIAEKIGHSLVELGVSEDLIDFRESLNRYVGGNQLSTQIPQCLKKMGIVSVPQGVDKQVELLLKKTRCLQRNAHYPVRLYCHIPGEVTELEEDATHFGYMLDGDCAIEEAKREMPLIGNSYFCIPGAAHLKGQGRCIIISQFGYRGVTHYGGEVEPWGRLRYIDGCTDSILVSPPRRGEPCFNALYFLNNTKQTQHVHPSLRCGIVAGGEGVCKTPFGDYPLQKGVIFFLPPETYHSFHTFEPKNDQQSALTVIAFHPDSDAGPTNQDHPMINRTYFKFLHRMVSYEREMAGVVQEQELVA